MLKFHQLSGENKDIVIHARNQTFIFPAAILKVLIKEDDTVGFREQRLPCKRQTKSPSDERKGDLKTTAAEGGLESSSLQPEGGNTEFLERWPWED